MDLTCAQCAKSFARRARGPVARYCSASCRAAASNKRAEADGRLALWDAATKARREAKLPTHTEHVCQQCDLVFTRPRARGVAPKFCSRLCADRDQAARWRADGRYDEMRARLRGPGASCLGCGMALRSGATRCRACHDVRQRADERRARLKRKAEVAAAGTSGRTWVTGRCPHCGAWFTDRQLTARHCSRRCRYKTMEGNRRAREAGVKITPGRRYAVHERDEWVCQLCGLDVDRKAVAPALLAPTIDHVVPLAAGGPHSEDNWQTAHFICNSHKRDLVA